MTSTPQADFASRSAGPDQARLLLGCVAVLLVVAASVMGLLGSDSWRRHGLDRGLAQLDLFYLDEPAPGIDRLGGPGFRRDLWLPQLTGA